MKKCGLFLICLLICGMFTTAAEENNYKMLDISSAANGRVYLDNEDTPGADVTWVAAAPGQKDFMIFKNDKTKLFAIQQSSLEESLTNGVLTDKKNVPYKINFGKVISVGSMSDKNVVYDIADGYYENLYFLYADIGGISEGIEITAEYSDGSKDVINNLEFENSYISSTTSTNENIAAIASRYNSFKNGQDFKKMQYVGIYRHEIAVNSDKMLEKVKFASSSDYELKIIAITAKTASIDKLVEEMQEQLNNLKADKDYLISIKSQLDSIESMGYDITTFDNYEAFLDMYDEYAAEKRYVEADISGAANSTFFIDSSPVPGQPIPWTDVVSSALDGCNYNGQTVHRMCVQTSSIKNMLTDGKFINADGVVYDMPLGKVITAAKTSPKQTLNMPNRAYKTLNILATTYVESLTGLPVKTTVTYTDGTTQEEEINVITGYCLKVGNGIVLAPTMYAAWNSGSFSADNTFGISEYAINTDATKEVESLTFECSSPNGVKIIAVTGTEAKNSLIKSALQTSILNLKTTGDYLFDIKTNIELLQSRGINTDDLEGLEEYERALAECVYVSDITEKTDFEKTDIGVNFINSIMFNEEHISVLKNGEMFTDCEIYCEDDKEIHIVFDNNMEYDAVYKITLSEELASKSGAFTLGSDMSYTVEVTPPIALGDAVISGDKSKITFTAKLTNNTESMINGKIIAAVYTEDGEMTDICLMNATAVSGMPGDVSITLTGKKSAAKIIAEIRIVDGYDNLKELYPVITKEI